jgi:hypothetical protein
VWLSMNVVPVTCEHESRSAGASGPLDGADGHVSTDRAQG